MSAPQLPKSGAKNGFPHIVPVSWQTKENHSKEIPTQLGGKKAQEHDLIPADCTRGCPHLRAE